MNRTLVFLLSIKQMMNKLLISKSHEVLSLARLIEQALAKHRWRRGRNVDKNLNFV